MDGSSDRSLPARAAWPVVVLIALAMSWWSLYSLALTYGVPKLLAVGVSTIFDGAALVLGAQAGRYAVTTDSGLMPRLGMVALVGLSAWLNWQHAVLLLLPVPARVMFSAPAVVAGLVWELERRWSHREAMRAVGRVPSALPPLGRWAWLFFPRRALRVQRSIVAAHLDHAHRAHMPPAEITAEVVSELPRPEQPERPEVPSSAPALEVEAGHSAERPPAAAPAPAVVAPSDRGPSPAVEGLSKRAALAAALEWTGHDVPASVAFLALQGVTVDRSDAYKVRRQLQADDVAARRGSVVALQGGDR